MFTHSPPRETWAVLLCAALVSACAGAGTAVPVPSGQTDQRSLSGTVLQPNGAALPGAPLGEEAVRAQLRAYHRL
jgi:hypothetical protein